MVVVPLALLRLLAGRLPSLGCGNMCPHCSLLGVQAEAQEYLASCDCPEYLRKAEKRLAEEAERVRNYLDPGSEPKITRVVESELILKQVCQASWSHMDEDLVSAVLLQCSSACPQTVWNWELAPSPS